MAAHSARSSEVREFQMFDIVVVVVVVVITDRYQSRPRRGSFFSPPIQFPSCRLLRRFRPAASAFASAFVVSVLPPPSPFPSCRLLHRFRPAFRPESFPPAMPPGPDRPPDPSPTPGGLPDGPGPPSRSKSDPLPPGETAKAEAGRKLNRRTAGKEEGTTKPPNPIPTMNLECTALCKFSLIGCPLPQVRVCARPVGAEGPHVLRTNPSAGSTAAART
jgi:hypothetical protein